MEIELYYFGLFFLVGIFSGFVDSIAGGGGMITVPVLLAAGIDPHTALATNKLQGTFGSFTAAANFVAKKMVSLKEVLKGIIFTFIGAVLGTILILFIDASFLKNVLPFVLAGIFLYTLFTPKLGENDRAKRLSSNIFYILFGLLLGFWDGFFGPGTGTFWTIAIVTILGLNLKAAVAQTKIFNFISNIVSFSVFAVGAKMLWSVGILMGVGQIIGAYVGSNLVIKKEAKYIKMIFLIAVGLTILKLFYDLYFG